MSTRFTLFCRVVNAEHARFILRDGAGANCGEITIKAGDLNHFLAVCWRGDIDAGPPQREVLAKVDKAPPATDNEP